MYYAGGFVFSPVLWAVMLPSERDSMVYLLIFSNLVDRVFLSYVTMALIKGKNRTYNFRAIDTVRTRKWWVCFQTTVADCTVLLMCFSASRSGVRVVVPIICSKGQSIAYFLLFVNEA